MDDDSKTFLQYNVSLFPHPGIAYAVAYLDTILVILGKYSYDYCRELRKALKAMKLVGKQDEITLEFKSYDALLKIITNFE
jgi:hypothetical protein